MREIRLARVDRTRPVVILTREAARAAMAKVTVAPITSTVKGLRARRGNWRRRWSAPMTPIFR